MILLVGVGTSGRLSIDIMIARRCRRLEVELTLLDSDSLGTRNALAAATSMVNPNLEVSVFPELSLSDLFELKSFDVAEEKLMQHSPCMQHIISLFSIVPLMKTHCNCRLSTYVGTIFLTSEEGRTYIKRSYV
jgi:hypothetical protein